MVCLLLFHVTWSSILATRFRDAGNHTGRAGDGGSAPEEWAGLSEMADGFHGEAADDRPTKAISEIAKPLYEMLAPNWIEGRRHCLL